MHSDCGETKQKFADEIAVAHGVETVLADAGKSEVAGDQFAIENWYLGSQYGVEEFRTADGSTLVASQVQNLVDAMAAFAPPAPGQTTLPDDYAAQLAPTIAANWH